MLSSPKTTILGILTILAAVAHAGIQYENRQPVDTATLFTAVSGGLGLVMAKDASTHSTISQTQQASRDVLKKG